MPEYNSDHAGIDADPYERGNILLIGGIIDSVLSKELLLFACTPFSGLVSCALEKCSGALFAPNAKVVRIADRRISVGYFDCCGTKGANNPVNPTFAFRP